MKSQIHFGPQWQQNKDGKTSENRVLQNLHSYYERVGNVVILTDEEGKMVGKYEYDPYGRIINWKNGENFKNTITYTGREYDRASGFYYNRARYYDPRVGRFITVYPILTQLHTFLNNQNL